MRLSALFLAIVLLLTAPGQAQRGQFSPDEMKQWLSTIASDDMQGRKLFSEGLGLTGAYIADHLKEWGVTPAGDSGTYFQTVRISGIRVRSNSTVTVTANGESRTFKDGQGVTFPRNQGGKQTVSGKVEFVGYGLEFAPLNQNDYAGRDMNGKVALYIGRSSRGMTQVHDRLVNARARNAIEMHHAIAAIGPVLPPGGRGRGAGPQGNTPAGENTADGGRASAPAANAPPAGAPGGNTPAGNAPAAAAAAARVDFQTVQSLENPIPPSITASDEFFEFIFSGSGRTYAELKALAAKQESLPDVALRDVMVTITIDAEYEQAQTQLSRNVVGIVRGSDSRLRDTYVVMGAHYDHVGYTDTVTPVRPPNPPAQAGQPAQGQPPQGGQQGQGGQAGQGGQQGQGACAGQRPTPRPGDIIFNGADDDGSGTTTLMAIAKAFGTGQKPRRSILFVWHTGEESGLYGSRYMADHPTVPLSQMVAVLNMDMVGRNRCDDPQQSNTVYVVGSERISTELHNLNEQANASLRQPLTLDYEYNDVSDLESIYTRSDHYSYASKGIPVAFFTTGLHRDYHAVTDEVDKIEFAKMARIAELIHATAMRVGNLDHAPARDNQGPRVGKGQTGPLR
jgi:hypothetical protein